MPDLLGDLVKLRHKLLALGLLDDPAFSEALVIGRIHLNEAGKVVAIRKVPPKTKLRIPTQPMRTSAPKAGFLAGRADYWVGGNSKRAAESRNLMADLHLHVIGHVDHPAARAIQRFFWAPAGIILPDDKIGFWIPTFEGADIHTIEPIAEAWRAAYVPGDGNPIIRLPGQPPSLRLVSANLGVVHSHGQEDPVLPPGVQSHAYGEALNWLTANHESNGDGENHYMYAWLSEHPTVELMQWLAPNRTGFDELPRWADNRGGTLHFLSIDARPPARISVRHYAVLDATQGLQRIRDWNEQVVRRSQWVGDPPDRLSWKWALTGPLAPTLVTLTIGAMLEGRPTPPGVAREMIRLGRKHPPRRGDAAKLGLLSMMAETQ